MGEEGGVPEGSGVPLPWIFLKIKSLKLRFKLIVFCLGPLT